MNNTYERNTDTLYMKCVLAGANVKVTTHHHQHDLTETKTWRFSSVDAAKMFVAMLKKTNEKIDGANPST